MGSVPAASGVLEKLRWQLKAVPDVRRQRVQELRRAISEGRFVISPERIAEGMLASWCSHGFCCASASGAKG